MKQFTYISGLPELQSLTTKEIKGKRHYLLPSGVYVPSVTTVLGFFKARSLMEWRRRIGEEEAAKITNRAATRGTRVHTLMEKYLTGEPTSSIITPKVMPSTKEAFFLMKKKLDNHVNNVHYVEVPLYSTVLKLAGRTDVIAEYDNVLSVIDFKTSNREKKEDHVLDYFLQSTAYALMFKERTGIPINQIVIMMASDGVPEPQIFIRNIEEYVNPLNEKIKAYFDINGVIE